MSNICLRGLASRHLTLRRNQVLVRQSGLEVGFYIKNIQYFSIYFLLTLITSLNINLTIFLLKLPWSMLNSLLNWYITYPYLLWKIFPMKAVTAGEPEVTGQYKLHSRTQHWMGFHFQSTNQKCQLRQFSTISLIYLNFI